MLGQTAVIGFSGRSIAAFYLFVVAGLCMMSLSFFFYLSHFAVKGYVDPISWRSLQLAATFAFFLASFTYSNVFTWRRAIIDQFVINKLFSYGDEEAWPTWRPFLIQADTARNKYNFRRFEGEGHPPREIENMVRQSYAVFEAEDLVPFRGGDGMQAPDGYFLVIAEPIEIAAKGSFAEKIKFLLWNIAFLIGLTLLSSGAVFFFYYTEALQNGLSYPATLANAFKFLLLQLIDLLPFGLSDFVPSGLYPPIYPGRLMQVSALAFRIMICIFFVSTFAKVVAVFMAGKDDRKNDIH
ncbi:MAG: hypothetical protein WDM91_04465 [Rhizomicrobium sp.]